MDSQINNFNLSFLSKETSGSNPFNYLSPSNKNINKYPKTNQKFTDEEKEIRCPICLGRFLGAARPNNCFHIYCSYC